ncbi:DUF2470 domain-containing protein [Plantibacter sp. Mn2098]|uniref:DUF2470 domain-containing protein n=1 Tax=Plantibacter sp. Mn2098 TaxID=3395266 RepID=UPI003BBF9B57
MNAQVYAPAIVDAVLAHMNGDHPDDNVLIVHAFLDATATDVSMTTFDGAGGTWAWTTAAGETTSGDVAWPGGPITERAEVRREIVALYDASCARLGVEPRPHA